MIVAASTTAVVEARVPSIHGDGNGTPGHGADADAAILTSAAHGPLRAILAIAAWITIA